MKISKLLVIASLSTLPALALAQATPGAPPDAPKAKAGAGAAVKGEQGAAATGGAAVESGAGATTGAGAQSGAAKKDREPGAPAAAPATGAPGKGESR